MQIDFVALVLNLGILLMNIEILENKAAIFFFASSQPFSFNNSKQTIYEDFVTLGGFDYLYS